jgi:predicted nucleic acid-binding protein
MMGAGVVLDTSFLIALADPTRRNHAVARRYWQYFMEQALPVFLPTIVVSEFYVRQVIPPEILRCCVVLPFNWDDAIRTAQLDFTQLKAPGESRVAIKDDVKIIAQAVICSAQHLITEDADSLARMASDLKAAGKVGFTIICLKDGFDRAFLDPSGQRDFEDAMGQTDAEPQ